jgi:hypothetical protein
MARASSSSSARRSDRRIPLSESRADGFAPGREWHRTSPRFLRPGKSGRQSKASAAARLEQQPRYLFAARSAPRIRGSGVQARSRPLREVEGSAPVPAEPSTREPPNPYNERQPLLADLDPRALKMISLPAHQPLDGKSRRTPRPTPSILRTMDNGGVWFSSTSLRISTSRLRLVGSADLLWRNR